MEFDSFRLAAATGDLEEEPAAREHADLLEFRMDLGEDPLDQLAAYDGELALLVTNRVEWEGGEADGEGRLADLALAAEHPSVAAVDVELSAVAGGEGTGVLERAREHGVTTVVSVHDFEETPEPAELRRLLERSAEYGDVAKLATTAESLDDALSLLATTRSATEAGLTVATMAMGEPGRHTRAVAPVYGSRIGYAPVDPERATAPGQYDLATLRRLVEGLTGATATGTP
jgi:3-dehydroquinate dehydratase-1